MKLSAPIHHLKRRAKRLVRDEGLALHEALDATAREEGFARWSLLSAQFAKIATIGAILSRLNNGDLLLLGARPGHGKTKLGLQLLLAAAHEGRRAVLFTFVYTEQEARQHFRALDADAHGLGDKLEIVASESICADTIIRHLSDSMRGTIALIDYLQLLDQQRSKPVLSEQVSQLLEFARETGVVLVFSTQIDRTFNPNVKRLPDVGDIRLPNPVDVRLFSKAWFLHDGEMHFQDIA